MSNSLKVLRHYPYRTAYVRDGNILIFPRDVMKDLEHYLAKIANVAPDNHVCYKVQMTEAVNGVYDDVVKYFMFTDSSVYIGNKISEGKW